MKPLRSPFETGQVPRRWYHCLFTPWRQYFDALKQQIEARGPVPEDAWSDQRSKAIAEKIEELIGESCWGELVRFHPDDPWLVIGEWEIGDLSEAELLMEVENTFEVKLPPEEDLSRLIMQGWTFRDMVSWIKQGAI